MTTEELTRAILAIRERRYRPTESEAAEFLTEILDMRKLTADMRDMIAHDEGCLRGARCSCGYAELAARFDALRKGWE